MDPNARPIRIDASEVDKMIVDLEKQARRNLAYGQMPLKSKPDVIAYALVDIPFRGTKTRTRPVSIYVRIVDRQLPFVALYDPVSDYIDIPVVVGKTADFTSIRAALLHELVHAADPNVRAPSHMGLDSPSSVARRQRRLVKQGKALEPRRRLGVGRREVRAHMAETVAAITPAIENRLVRMAEMDQTIATAQYNDLFRDALYNSRETWPQLATRSRDFDNEFNEFVKGVWTGVEDELAKWKTDDGRTLKEVVIVDGRKRSTFDDELAEALAGRREVSLGALEQTYARRHRR